ncbi:MAG: peptidase M6, partial [Mesorhizobium sp.]
GVLPPSHYQDLLFSQGIYPTGSMRDYFKEVSLGKVDVVGTVDGWIRMPKPYSFYTNNESGTNWNSYPHNAPRLAEDAVNAALAGGVKFAQSLDKFGRGI